MRQRNAAQPSLFTQRLARIKAEAITATNGLPTTGRSISFRPQRQTNGTTLDPDWTTLDPDCHPRGVICLHWKEIKRQTRIDEAVAADGGR